MNDPSKSILRGVKIEGTVFCNPVSQSRIQPPQDERIKAEEENKSLTSDSKELFDNIYKACKQAEQAGYHKGLIEGRQQGYEAGRSEGVDIGFKQGFLSVQDQFKNSIALLNLLTNAFQGKKEDLFLHIKPEIIKFCLILCERIIQKELSNREAFLHLIDKLLEQVKSIVEDEPIKVVVSPEDLLMLNHSLQSFEIGEPAFQRIYFSVDPKIERGNCRVETTLGMLNFDLKRMLKDLESKILEV